MKTIIIVQARMTSTRLPGKVLKEVLGKPLLEYQIERLRQVRLADELVIATTTNDTDQPIVELCEHLGGAYYRGSEEDVLSRYYEAATQFKADAVVRVTSDCSLIDPGVMDEVIGLYINNRDNYDYVSNTLERTYPRGLDTEVFSMAALEKAYKEAGEQPDREHVTLFM
ncbi:MAG TPA: acylneuraminate cytidylyltransferase, partial [Syntrophomonas sp.]|nr:acylneuraminate cytidylyltransferase [Syntrophomonas sp.]